MDAQPQPRSEHTAQVVTPPSSPPSTKNKRRFHPRLPKQYFKLLGSLVMVVGLAATVYLAQQSQNLS